MEESGKSIEDNNAYKNEVRSELDNSQDILNTKSAQPDTPDTSQLEPVELVGFETFPAVPTQRLSKAYKARTSSQTSEPTATIPIQESEASDKPYGALSPSVQARLSNAKSELVFCSVKTE